MARNPEKILVIDLNLFKFHLNLKPGLEFTLHFDSPSRRFYLSVIALVVHEMKKKNRFISIPLCEYLNELVLLNKTIGESAGSSKKEHLLPRIYRKWKDALPDLENAPLFKVVGKKKKYSESMEKIYQFNEEEKDTWANLFEYKGSHENVRLRFSIDHFSIGLEDIVIVYGENPLLSDATAWETFLDWHEKHMDDQLATEEDTGKHRGQKGAVTDSISGVKRVLSNRQRIIISICVISILFSTIFLFIWQNRETTLKSRSVPIHKMDFPLPANPSIAVLPFRNLSNDTDLDYFCDGLTEEIISALCKSPRIFVIAHNSTSFYKNKQVTVRKVSEDLGVQYVLEGSIQKNNNQIRVTAKLTDTVNGIQLWAEHYDQQLEDIFKVYDGITLKIISAMRVVLSKNLEDRFFKKGTDNIEAWLKVLQGIEHLRRFNPVDNTVSLQLFEKAIAIAPDYPIPYAFSATTYAMDVWMGTAKSNKEALNKGLEFALKAISMDKDLCTGHAALAGIYLLMRQHQKAFEAATNFISLCPNSPDGYNLMSQILTFSGRPEEAIDQIKISMRLDPLSRSHYYFLLGMAYREAERYDEAIQSCLKAVKNQPGNILARVILVSTYSMAGRLEEAKKEVAELLKRNPNFSLRHLAKVRPHIDPKNTERFIQSLIRAGLPDS